MGDNAQCAIVRLTWYVLLVIFTEFIVFLMTKKRAEITVLLLIMKINIAIHGM